MANRELRQECDYSAGLKTATPTSIAKISGLYVIAPVCSQKRQGAEPIDAVLAGAGPVKPWSSSWRTSPVATIESSPSSAAREAPTCGPLETASRRNGSDHTLVSTSKVIGANAPPCSRTSKPLQLDHQIKQMLVLAPCDELLGCSLNCGLLGALARDRKGPLDEFGVQG